MPAWFMSNTNQGIIEIKGKIIKASRERYARPREEVEAKIAQWSGMGGMGM